MGYQLRMSVMVLEKGSVEYEKKLLLEKNQNLTLLVLRRVFYFLNIIYVIIIKTIGGVYD